MIRDRYDPIQLFDLVPQLHLRFDPELAQLDRLLEDEVLFQSVKADLCRRRPRSAETGRWSTPVEVILRLLVVKHLYGWSYEDTERYVNDSLVLRQFCRLGFAPAPDDTTLLRWANLIQPATLHRLLDRVTALALQLRVTRGRKLRTDSTVVATAIHHPTDSSLLADGVRRLVGRARQLLDTTADAARRLCRNRTRSARRLARRIATTTAQRQTGAAEPPSLYRRLLTVVRASLGQAERVRRRLPQTPGALAQRLQAALDHCQPLVGQVITQARRRVLRGETVPATEKVTSLFEPHTAVIRRGKVHQPTELGSKVVLDEVEGGLATRYVVEAGNPPDAPELARSLAHHQERFGHAPPTVAADRNFYTAANERLARQAGVHRVGLPKPGARAPDRVRHERQRWFRRTTRFRAGIEGRISVLKRGFGLARCRYHGAAGMERWVGWGVLAHNLRVISRAVARRKAR